MVSLQKIISIITLLLATELVIVSCKEEDEFTESTTMTLEEQLIDEGLKSTRLGEKLENPYSIENMRMALDSLRATPDPNNPQEKVLAEDLEIMTTDLYVRFLPRDGAQYEAMLDNEDMILFDHPLDYEIAEQGDFYLDPSVPEGMPGWQYSVVEPDYTFPDTLEYEILSELFIPQNHPLYTSGKGKVTDAYSLELIRLEIVSLYLTGNLTSEDLQKIALEDDSENLKTTGLKTRGIISNIRDYIDSRPPRDWHPKGSVRVIKKESGMPSVAVGIPEIRVIARSWFTIGTDKTGTDGFFTIDNRFFPSNRDVLYTAIFHDGLTSVKLIGNSILPAVSKGKTHDVWDLNAAQGTKEYLWGTTMLAVSKFYEDTEALFPTYADDRLRRIKVRPCLLRDCRTWLIHDLKEVNVRLDGEAAETDEGIAEGRTASAAFTPELILLVGVGVGVSVAAGITWEVLKAIMTDLVIGGKDQSYEAIFAKVYHHLGHVFHMNVLGREWLTRVITMGTSFKMAREAWALGISNHLYEMEFGEPLYPGCHDGRLEMIRKRSPKLLVRDLLDNVNEHTGIAPCNINDPIYSPDLTVENIFFSLNGISSIRPRSAMEQWKDNLLGQNEELDEEELTDYFNQYKILSIGGGN